MNKDILPKFLIILIATLCVFSSGGTLFIQRAAANPAPEDADQLHLQAQEYRQAGLGKQRIGSLSEAMGLYQKAIAIDPGYAVAYNDLGVVYEAMGLPERAEESYLKSLKIDPGYSGAYSNLALFYENKGDLEKAALYWGKRAQIGSPDDPWTQKAARRFKDIRMSKQPISEQREE
ncbi:MAG: tetratricopeptide repeat protein [Candidatus Omnitrophica bacterium]|nr:tetratricopeptide repeat protein [Candidatus Omnitrophota bacterium]